MIARLDKKSRSTITRFIVKLAICALIATFVTEHRLVSIASWLSFYALFAAISGLISKEQIAEHSFNSWDEALWLVLVSTGLQMMPDLF